MNHTPIIRYHVDHDGVSYEGTSQLGEWPEAGFPRRSTIITRTREEGYGIAAWLLLKGLDIPVRPVEGITVPLGIVDNEGCNIMLTWDPAREPTTELRDCGKSLHLLVYPPATPK